MQKTKARKSKFVVAMAVALCLVFMMAMGGFTYAKFVSTGKIEAQSATVAKWGFVVNTQGGDMFADAYGTTKGKSIAYTTTGNTVGVKATSADTNLVAPGTTGSLTFSVKGVAEVRSKLTFTLDENNKTVELSKDGAVVYAPIKWTLTKAGETEALVDKGTFAELATAIAGLNQTAIAPLTELDDAYTLTWAWAFEGDDELDTYLGRFANGETVEGYTAQLTVSFGMTISIEQIQGADAE